jgi:hypothetical protein
LMALNIRPKETGSSSYVPVCEIFPSGNWFDISHQFAMR